MMNWDKLDWTVLERLRSAYLRGAAGAADYWHDDNDLATYDFTFAQRIAWKWDFVLDELQRLGWSPPAGEVLDWGCGSGVAGRSLIRRFGREDITGLALLDRSALAVAFAQRRARGAFPGLDVRLAAHEPLAPTVLLSHVITELTPQQIDQLVKKLTSATAIIWVEAATHESSRALIAIRERLLAATTDGPGCQPSQAAAPFRIVAPCTHQGACGMLAAGNERHWCHFFASPPPEVFTDGNWARVAHQMHIDLRALPLSYLVLDRRPAAPAAAEPDAAAPPAAVRVIGRPRTYKGYALLFGCDAQGVRDLRLAKKRFADHYRLARKDELDSLLPCRLDGEEITDIG